MRYIIYFSSLTFLAPISQVCLVKYLPATRRKKVLVMVIAENMEIKIPMAKVTAKPLIKLEPNQNKITQVIKLETLESLMEFQALAKPSSILVPKGLPFLISSLVLSKIKTLASTAIPIDKIKPAMPDKVKVIDHISKIAPAIKE